MWPDADCVALDVSLLARVVTSGPNKEIEKHIVYDTKGCYAALPSCDSSVTSQSFVLEELKI